MSVDMNKMRRGFQREQRAGEYLQLEQGETLLYIHPQCRADDKFEPTDGVNYVPVVIHYGVGKGRPGKDGKSSKGSMVASLDPELNTIIEHPFVKRILKKSKKKLTGKCPIAKALASGTLDDDEANEMRASTRYVWGVTPIGHRAAASSEFTKLAPKPSVLMCGKTVFDGIMEVFFDNGDITDPEAAVLVIVKRDGKDMTTKYAVRADPASLKKPRKIGSEARTAVAKALKEDGDCDLFKVVANMIKSTAEVEALMTGVRTEDVDSLDDEEDETPAPKKKPAAVDEDAEDDGEADLADDEEETEDEDEEEVAAPPPPKTKTGKPAAKPVPAPLATDEEEDDADSDDEDEGDDDVADDGADDDDSVDDEDDDSAASDADDEDEVEEEAEEPAPPPAPKPAKVAAVAKPGKATAKPAAAAPAPAVPAKPSKVAKPTPKPVATPAEDDDDLGLGEIDAELARIEAAKPAAAAKPKKTK